MSGNILSEGQIKDLLKAAMELDDALQRAGNLSSDKVSKSSSTIGENIHKAITASENKEDSDWDNKKWILVKRKEYESVCKIARKSKKWKKKYKKLKKQVKVEKQIRDEVLSQLDDLRKVLEDDLRDEGWSKSEDNSSFEEAVRGIEKEIEEGKSPLMVNDVDRSSLFI